jgi:hypothetical protein
VWMTPMGYKRQEIPFLKYINEESIVINSFAAQ